MTTSSSPLSLRRHGAAVLWLLALTALLFLLTFEQGVATGGVPVFHELAHDARHLLGAPCH